MRPKSASWKRDSTGVGHPLGIWGGDVSPEAGVPHVLAEAGGLLLQIGTAGGGRRGRRRDGASAGAKLQGVAGHRLGGRCVTDQEEEECGEEEWG